MLYQNTKTKCPVIGYGYPEFFFVPLDNVLRTWGEFICDKECPLSVLAVASGNVAGMHDRSGHSAE
jgi:hypothetical protein